MPTEHPYTRENMVDDYDLQLGFPMFHSCRANYRETDMVDSLTTVPH